jgi:hypothetical protein
MNPDDRVLVTDPRAGAFYGAQARILEVNGDRAKIAAKGRRPCELPMKWLAPLEEVDASLRGVTPKESTNGFGVSPRNTEPLESSGSVVPSPSLESDAPSLRGVTPKESADSFGVSPRKTEPLSEAAIAASLSTLCDRLRAKGTLPGWIEQDRKGEQTYHRYRWYENGKQPQRAIPPKELSAYRDRVRRGQIVSHAEALLRLLEEEMEF